MNKEITKTTQVVKSPQVVSTPLKEEKKSIFGFLSKDIGGKDEPVQQIEKTLEEGMNLMPTPSKAEVEKESKKAVLNVGSALSLLTLVLVSVFIISFNIMSKMELNGKKEDLYAYEERMKRNSQEIIDNTEIVDRIFLYKGVREEAFSPKEVVEYIQDIADQSGGIDIRTYDIQDSLAFEFTGESQDLEKVSKFWYLLSNNGSIETINLDSVSTGESGARFSFEGQFIYENFVNVSTDENS